MEYIGKYGEYLVLAKLLKMNIEAYLAIKTNQNDYDVTAIKNANLIRRIQVKTTELNNKSTNNPVSNVKKKYDYLVIVIVDDDNDRYFILSKEEVAKEISKSNALYTTEIKKGKFYVKENIKQYENMWEKIFT